MSPKLRTYPPQDDPEVFGAGSPRSDLRHWRIVEQELVDDGEARDVDFDSNELLDGGSRCAHCGKVIEPDAFVRRAADRRFVHEACSGG